MKIAYFTEWDFSQPSGVAKKIQSQVQIWNQSGAQARLYAVSSRPPGSFALSPQAHFYNSPRVPFRAGGARTYLNKIFCVHQAHRDLADWKPDLIYYRLGIWYPGLCSLLRVEKSLVEINSLELNELDGANVVKRQLYPWGRRQVLAQASGFVCVSHEISQDLGPINRPVFVCGNGYDFSSVSSPSRQVISSRPQALFVSSDNQFWQGVDLLLHLAKDLPEIDFHLVGISTVPASPNVRFHGPLFGEPLANLTRQMDFGIGTLALHRKKMNEASPLKTREYGAWGLPFIYAYTDTDLPENVEFALKLSNSEAGLLESMGQIREFANRWQGQQHDPTRFYAYFDLRAKEARRLAFMSRI